MIKTRPLIIVTGATGFIGKHLIKRLVALDFGVIAVTRSNNNIQYDDSQKVIWLEWSEINNYLKELPISPIAIIHLATAYGRNGESILAVEEGNVFRPLQLLELAVEYKIGKFINTDSYFSKPCFNYQYMRSYILSKDSFRRWGEFVSSQSDLQFINMRLEHVYGHGDGQGKFIPYILSSFINNEPVIECTDCTQRRDFIYIDDVVSAYTMVLTRHINEKYSEFQVGCGTSIPLREFIETIKAKLPQSKTKVKYGILSQRDNEILDSRADNDALHRLGWSCFYDINTGIDEMLSQYNLPK